MKEGRKEKERKEEKEREKEKEKRRKRRGRGDDSRLRGWKVRIKIQISQPRKSPHFEVRRAQWANMNTLQRVCIQPRTGNAFY